MVARAKRLAQTLVRKKSFIFFSTLTVASAKATGRVTRHRKSKYCPKVQPACRLTLVKRAYARYPKRFKAQFRDCSNQGKTRMAPRRWVIVNEGNQSKYVVLERTRDNLANQNEIRASMILSTRPSTTLADSFTRRFGADPSSAVRTSLRWQASDELDDGVAHGRQAWLRRWPVDSFFPASLLSGGDAGGRRKRSSS